MSSDRSLGRLPLLFLFLILVPGLGCSRSGGPGSATMPVHLEDLLGSAAIEGAEVPAEPASSVRWELAGDAEGWRGLPSLVEGGRPAEIERTGDALRVRLTEASLAPPENGFVELYGGVSIDVPDLDLDAWTHALVEARATGSAEFVGIGYNVREEPGETPDEQWATRFYGSEVELTPDGETHVYRIALVGDEGPAPEPVRQIAIELGAGAPAEVELLSVRLVPATASYAQSGVGVRSVSSSAHEEFGPRRRALYAHAPSRISFPLRIPAAGRLDVALGSLGGPARMTVLVENGGSIETLLRETVPPAGAWRQRSVNLSRWAGREVTLTLAAEEPGDGPGGESELDTIALWASPTVSSAASSGTVIAERPNVVFYVIDGASANHMSVYGYERPTTPNLERIAEEGVVFERAHSNSTWTMPSTASFMTSLHHSVLGGLRDDANPVPPDVKTMAEHFHDAGFHTGVFTFNPNAGGLSGLDRAVDVFRDFGKRGAPLDPIEAISSTILHEQFWQWREAYPGPYWVHFQTTDVHPPHHPQEPFAGRVVPEERSEALARQMVTFRFPFNHTSASVHEHWQGQLAERDIDPQEFYGTMRDAHDEAMMHQDHRLGELVDRLKATGQWETTLLVVASDHGHPAASYPRFGRGLLDPQPPAWEGALLGEFESHVPLIFIWPGRIEGGRRIEAPVSMIDVLPTLLELVGLPGPELAQGRSLAPLLLGEEGWEPRPVVFDEFRVADDGSLVGNLEILDGRWGQSLEIRTAEDLPGAAMGRHPAPAGGRWKALPFEDVPRLLLYDLESDPEAVRHVTGEHPERAAEAQRRLWRLWQEHRELAARFEAGERGELTPDQMEALRALGYVE